MTLDRRDFVNQLLGLGTLGLLSGAAAPAAAQTAWPAKPLLMVIAYAAGGATGSIGAEAGAKMAGDGHQFLVSGSSTHAANVSLYKSLPFDPERDFAPVTTLAQVPYFLVVNPAKVPVADFKGFVDFAKAHPGKLS